MRLHVRARALLLDSSPALSICYGGDRSRDLAGLFHDLRSGQIWTKDPASTGFSARYAKKLGQRGRAFLIRWFVEELWNGRLGGRFRDRTKRLKRIPGEFGVHLNDFLRLRDERFVGSFRIFGANFHRFLERSGTRQFFIKFSAFLKRSFGIIGVRCRDRLEVLREFAGGFGLPFEVVLKLLDAIHDNAFRVSRGTCGLKKQKRPA